MKRVGLLTFVLALFWVFQGRAQTPAPGEIELSYDSNVIASGSTTISAGAGTDYGVGFIGNDANLHPSIEYQISNTDNSGIINVSNIYFDGDNSTDFSISGITFPVAIGGGESISFMVTFAPVSALSGPEDLTPVDMDRVAELHVVSNDLDESDYAFSIGGMAAGEATVQVGVEIAGETYDDVHGYYTFANIAEELLATYSRTGADGIKTVFGVVDTVFGCGDDRGVGTHPSSDDAILTINPQGVLPEQRWYFFFDDNSVAGYPVRNTTGYAGIGTTLYTGKGTGTALLSGVGLDGAYTDYLFFVEPAYEAMMGNTPTTFTNLELLGEYYADTIFLDSRVLISDPDLQVLNAGQGFYNGSTLQIERQGGVNTDDYFQLEESILFSLRNDSIFTQEYYIGQYDNTGHQMTLNFEGSSRVIVSQRMLNDIVQHITYHNANGVTAPLSFSYVFDDGTSETTGIKTVNPNIEEVFYVDLNATGLNNGTSWVNAYNSLQDALARASSGDQVWVAAGEYLPTSGTDREASFRVASGVSIYGSLPSGASALTAQDTAAYPTILSGNIGDPATNTDNVYNVVTFGPVSDFTLLKGLHITGGYADRSDNFFYGNGAGVFNSNFATDSTSGVVLQDLMLYGNTAVLNGGAVYSNGSIWISGCNIFQNEAEDGGAVYNGGIIRISSCDISQNQAVDGSGIYNDNAVVVFSGTNCVLRDVKIHHNTAGDDGGGIASKEAISVYDCDISNNEIDGSGGACYFDLDEGTLGDSIRIVRTKLNNNLLTDTEDEGAAVYMNSDCPVPPVVLFAECLVQGNEGEDGTFYFDVDGDNGDIIVFLESCLFSGNTVYDDGAALMGPDDTQFWVYNTTFAGNYADDDGCVIETGSSSKATLYNCISFGNDANDGSDGIIDAAGDIDIFNCYFEHGEDRMSVSGDLSVNTLFTADDFEDAAFEDFTFDAVDDTPTAEGNFALSKISPLVNLGDNGYATNLEKDLAGNARLQEGTVDLGAYESSPLFFAGLGTAASPYQIKDWEHLHNVRFRMDAHFILINDLDKNSSGYQEYVAGSGWLPIGTMDGDVLNGTGTVTGFTGHFDGQGYSINDLQIDNGLSYGNGLFFALGAFEGANLMKADEEDFIPSVIIDPSFLDSLQSLGGAAVHNLKLDSAIVGSSIMFAGDNLPLFPNGILAGFVHNSQIDSISASGTIRMGGGVVGAVLESRATNTQLSFLTTHIQNELLGAGIAGCLGINTLVTDSRAHIQSSDQGSPVGISLLNAGEVSRCFATVTSTLATPSPPFLPSGISLLLTGKIEESAAHVNFSFGAGLAVFSLSGQINNAYVTGSITQGSGLVYQNDGLVGNTYVAIETNSVAGLFDINSGMVSNSFWDAELSGQSGSAADEGKTTCEMKTADLFTAAGWDFEGETNNGNDEIWRIVDSAGTISYPYLSALTYDAIGAVPEVNPIPGLDTLLPTAVCMDITAYLDASGEANIMSGDIGAGSMISCDTLTLSLSQTAFSCDEQGENTVVLTTTDSANNTDTCSAIVTVLDTIAPVASCTDLTVYLDNAGEGTISTAQADGGSTDNCGSVSLSLSDSTFTCDDLSLNTEAILGSGAGFRSPESASGVSVVLIATDGSDNIDSCMLTVTVLDTIAPVASCTDLTVYLDNAGEGNISAAQADGGSTDNCGSVSLSLSDSTFTCGDLGQQEVTLIVTEGATASSGSDSCMSMITVLDTIAPVASCADLTVYLDNAGEGTISAAQADGGSADNCGSVSLSLSDSTFTCGDLGQKEVTLIVTEGATAASGSGSCMSMITVLDTIAPVASCTDLTVYLDNAGEGTISTAQADGGSTDACGLVSLSLSDSTFTCDDLSLNTEAILDSGEGFRSPQSASGVSIVLIATDGSDNIDSCMLTVTVLDTISPVMACTDVPVSLDEMGAASIDVSDVDTGTTDNCGSPMLQLSQTSFSCSDIGEVSVSLTATDGSGNSNSCEVTVTVSGPDADCDGDGLTNAEEDELGTDSFAADTDGDGVIDGTEVSDMTSPTDACSFVLGSQSVAPATDWNMSDCDGDGLTNAEEADTYSTNPLEADTDGDGVTDGSEVADSSSPLEICDYVYSSVTLPKGEAWANEDCDGDGLSNEVEGDETIDTDGDLAPDCFDLDSDNDGLLDATEQGTGQGNENTAFLAMIAADIDGDSILNFRDLDSDGDGCFDAVEASDDLTPADLDSEGRIPGGVDENGVPLTAGMEGFAAAEAWSSNEIAGEFCGSDIGGYVWLDNDRNGFFSQDGNTDAAPVLAALGEAYANLPDNENTLPGVQVRLYGTDLNGNPVDEVQTADADGYYLFELVLGGEYCMEVSFEGLDSAEDYVLTIPDVEGDALDEQDSDYSLEGELCFTLEAGAASVYDLNAGVFLDADGDFIPDVIDPDIGGEMLDPQGFIYCENTGEIISGGTIEVTGPGNVTMVADGSTGFYQWFVDASGVYTMTLNAPAGYDISTDCTDSGQLDPEPGITIVGSSEEAMSGFMEDASCGANPFYMEFVLSPGDLVLNNNLPLVCAEIGDRAWKDFDRDGLQSPGEPGLGYTEVRLLDCSGNGVDTVVSDIEGRFLFTGLPAGGYVLDYEGRAEWAGSLPNLWSYAGYQAGAAELDSDITASGSTECVTLGVGEKNYTVDGGYEVPYTYSCNCDGSITLEWSPISGEPGVTYTVDIEDSAGNPVLDYVNMTETSVTIAHGTLQNGEEYRLAITENISTSNVVSITGPLYADCNPVPMASVISAAGPACPGGTDGSVLFELEESGCAGRYAVYLEQAGSDILVAGDTTLANSFSVSGLGEGSYSLRVELLDTLSCGYGVGCFPLEVEDFVVLSNQDLEGPSLEVSAQGGVGLGSGASFTYTPPEGECGVQLEWLAITTDNCSAVGSIGLSVSIESDVAGVSPWAAAVQTSSGYAVSVHAGIGTNTVVLAATDEAGNSTELSYEITVVDSRAPEIYGPGDMQVQIPGCEDSAPVNWQVSAIDDCGLDVILEQVSGPESGSALAPGMYTVAYEATDGYGNTSQYSFDITLTQAQSPAPIVDVSGNGQFVIEDCAEDGFIVFSGHIYDCELQPGDVLDGLISISGAPLELTYIQVDEGYAYFEATGSLSSGSYLIVTSYEGVSIEHAVEVVQDADTPAVMTMPGNLAYQVPNCEGEAAVSFAVQLEDDCDQDFSSASFTVNGAPAPPFDAGLSDPANGYFAWSLSLSPGVYTIVGTYTDGGGNTTEATATVTVNADEDNSAPIIVYPSQNINIALDPCIEAAVASQIFQITAIDNCDGDLDPTVTVSSGTGTVTTTPGGYVFMGGPGVHTITITATDAAGNSRTESFSINVTQAPAPQENLACNDDINVTLDDNCSRVITADMVLEGNFGCFEESDFTVTIVNDDNPANGNILDGHGQFIYEIALADQAQPTIGFTGDFAPGNWDLIVNDPAMTVGFNGDVLELGSPGDPVTTSVANAAIAMPESGTVSFDWTFFTNEFPGGALFELFGYVIDANGNITETILASDGTVGTVGPDGTAEGSESFDLNAGDVLVFILQVDGFFPLGAEATVSNFTFEPSTQPVAGFEPCWGFVTGEDKTAPVVECPDDTDVATISESVQKIQGALETTDAQLELADYSCFLDGAGPVAGGQYYDIIEFQVSADDIYTIYLNTSWGDGFTALYQGSFDADSPCENILYAADDNILGNAGPIGGLFDPQVRVTLPLRAYETYFVLVSSFGSDVTGSYEHTIFSDGNGLVGAWNFTETMLPDWTIQYDTTFSALPSTTEQLSIPLFCDDFGQIYGGDAGSVAQETAFISGTYQWVGAPSATDNCDNNVGITATDSFTASGDCGDVVITRSFTATDDQGLTDECQQQITIRKPTLDDVNFPSFTAVVECDEDFPTLANGNPAPELTGYPFIFTAFGIFDIAPNYCNIGASYEDLPTVDECEGRFKFRREWTIFDWCDPGSSLIANQLIKVGDYTAPEVSCPAGTPIAYSTSPFSCGASFEVPMPSVSDNCSNVTVYTEIVTTTEEEVINQYGLPTGQFVIDTVVVRTIQPGANRFVSSIPFGGHFFRYVAEDDCGNETELYCPFSVIDEIEPVAVCDDQLNVSIGGGNIVPGQPALARVFASDVDEGSWDNCGDVSIAIFRNNFNPVTYTCGTQNSVTGDFVDFFCCDVGVTSDITLVVTDQYGNQNSCWLSVTPEDKINPFCDAPDNVVVDCDGLPYGFDASDADQLEDLFGMATGADNCGVADVQQVAANADLECGYGSITRIFRVTDVNGLSSTNSCVQVITINEVHNYEIYFPEDAEANCGTPTPDTVEYNELGCGLLAVTSSDEQFSASGDECYKIFRTWKVINWCQYDGESDPYIVGRDEDCNGTPGDGDRIANNGNGFWLLARPNGKIYFDQDTDETPDNNVPGINFCGVSNDYYSFEYDETGYYQYTQIIKVYDDTAPEISFTQAGAFCSLDNVNCDANVTYPFSIDEDCTPDDLTIKVFLDPFLSGDLVELTGVVSGSYPDYTITVNGLPIGSHAFEVHVLDGCGNSDLAILPFDIIDCKAPAPFCLNGIAIELMPVDEDGDNLPDPGAGMAEIWASDFVDFSTQAGDCSEPIKYSINRVGEPNNPDQTGLVLTCDDEGTLVIEIWAYDAAGNSDFCETYILVQDNMGVCGAAAPMAAGAVNTEDNEPVEDVQVSLSGQASTAMTTQNDGAYVFTNLTSGLDYTITPQRDGDYLNGVSTFDLVLISKHILGVGPLSTPYQRIAADVNNSGSITTLDLIQLRKLILSIDTEFANNTSWRFVETAYVFPDPSNPWAEQFPEVININDLPATSITDADFVAVKIGDVNGDATANSFAVVDERSYEGAFALQTDEQELKAGNEYRVSFTAAELARIEGYQATLTLSNGVELVDIVSGVATEDNFGLSYLGEGMITTSWHWASGASAKAPTGIELFTLVLRANSDVMLSEVLGVSSAVTKAEAYGKDGSFQDVAIEFGSASATASADRFELYQNQPNPFKGETVIGFNLPEAAQVTITISDVTGKVLKLYRQDGSKGYNHITVKSSELAATGVVQYTVSTGTHSATKRMVIVE